MSPRPPYARSAPPRRTLAAALAVALVLAFAGFSAWRYAAAATRDDLAFGRERDRVLAAGQEHIGTLNSIDAADPDAGLARWEEATTGPLHEDLRRSRAASAGAVDRAGVTVRATVTEAAVTELDPRAGTAKALATVRVETSGGAEGERTDRKRFEAGLERTGDGWKIASLTAITVEGSDS
ncbi:hypothetical protein DMB38_12505 [Streptomyces sp. WAC 06738]|uniref:hypothetical protein n=1 Tax=Streptomyces sp. WAC 06738 TaxID=2203210 RepID=UPI000F6FC020|nr:hypothetical protein [Streptomyces sp. WAC 06738]AZM46530.1 hypothetical protein DMB38_12505 [Streptomyces sp. WAC 06738]